MGLRFYLPPLPPLRPGPLRRRFANNIVFLEVFGEKCFKRLRWGPLGGPRGGVSGVLLGPLSVRKVGFVHFLEENGLQATF